MAVLSSLLTLSILTLLTSPSHAQSTTSLIEYPTPISTTVIGGSTYFIKSATAPEATQSGGFQCPLAAVQADGEALEYAFNIQTLLYNYYAAQDLNTTSFDSLQSPGGNFNALDTALNFQGLRTQADLGRRAINELGGMTAGFATPAEERCDYSYPAGLSSDDDTSVQTFLHNAFLIEATLCGAFIGLADYVQLPQSASLMARLAAEHAIHASYIRGFFASQPLFAVDSTSLTPAFTPEQVLSDSPTAEPFTVGYLGQFLSGHCANVMPSAPCGAEVSFGPLLPSFSYISSPSTSSMTGRTATVATSTATALPVLSFPSDSAGITVTSTSTATDIVVPPLPTLATSTTYETASTTVSAAVTSYTGAAAVLRAPGKRLADVVGVVRRVVGGA